MTAGAAAIVAAPPAICESNGTLVCRPSPRTRTIPSDPSPRVFAASDNFILERATCMSSRLSRSPIHRRRFSPRKTLSRMSARRSAGLRPSLTTSMLMRHKAKSIAGWSFTCVVRAIDSGSKTRQGHVNRYSGSREASHRCKVGRLSETKKRRLAEHESRELQRTDGGCKGQSIMRALFASFTILPVAGQPISSPRRIAAHQLSGHPRQPANTAGRISPAEGLSLIPPSHAAPGGRDCWELIARRSAGSSATLVRSKGKARPYRASAKTGTATGSRAPAGCVFSLFRVARVGTGEKGLRSDNIGGALRRIGLSGNLV
jgi:hypothetical protein